MSVLNSFSSWLDREFAYRWSRDYHRRRRAGRIAAKYYSPDIPESSAEKKTVVYMADGRTVHGGLADRLRGMVSVFDACLEAGIDFRINFTFPFRLERYLQPADYDWRISADEISYSTSTPVGHYLDASDHCPQRENAYQRERLRRFLALPFRQAHIYTNYTCGEHRFAELFARLFKPAPEVEGRLAEITRRLGPDYISVSTRFLELLGDFDEPKQKKLPLQPEEQRKLICKCLKAIKGIHEERCEATGEECKVLVTSDSEKFLEEAAKLPFVKIIPGSISHIDVHSSPDNSEADLKTFVDFFAIARAAESVLLVGPGMYRSNFSRRASEAGGHPFRIIELKN